MLFDDEAQAIEGCRAGNREAFRYLVRTFQHEALVHAATLLGSRAEAEDAVQDAFVDAWGAMGRFEAGRRFYPWFYTILRHRCLKRIGAQKRLREESLEEAVLVQSGDVQESVLLNSALQALSEVEREVVLLRHVDGLSYEELAARLEIPVGTVMSRLFYARRKLRASLEGGR